MKKTFATMIVASIFMVGCKAEPPTQDTNIITVQHDGEPLECVEVTYNLKRYSGYYGLSCDWVGYHNNKGEK